ncbi:Lrp/AsnC family transcriptional regulator [Leptolyngbya ohadii]|uniref:Lrp/AsnC family transcriptional regulator n=1 Tax=Leptolyngbya ohadii TaxID=1962290 RepID=UPI000B59BE96|nr:Lrp/AsnC family transcriptional regulator [Leptolyngbya ohadii]
MIQPTSNPTSDRLQLDDLDIQIVQILHKDGRMAFTEIAKRVGVSEATIRNRVQRLLESNAIKIQAYLNPDKLGFRQIALIDVKLTDLAAARRVAQELVSIDSISYVAFVTGDYDLFLEVTYDSNETLLNFLAELRARSEVLDTKTTTVLKLLKTQYSFQV